MALVIMLAASCPVCHAESNDSILHDSERLRDLVVTGKRKLSDIGIQKTTFDSTALKDNIALSMADILTYNSALFVKNYGRATLSTVAFRGTSPSHTQVTWNGIRIDNPMLGMTDFSTIPSYFVDNASLLHGSSSLTAGGGALGGAVTLNTAPESSDGLTLQYIQGVGSFRTFDEFLRVNYGSPKWSSSTRVACSSSPNDYKYINHDKKINIYDDNHNIVGQYHPTERNRSGAYRDLHALQEIYYRCNSGDRIGLDLWFVDSRRELPVLTTDYSGDLDFENRQHETTFRSVVSWLRNRDNYRLDIRGGYVHTSMAYDYKREASADKWVVMTRSRSRVNSIFGQADAGYSPSDRWYFSANISARQHFVRSEDRNVTTAEGGLKTVGYDQARIEFSAAATARWQAHDRLGLSLLLRQGVFGDRIAPLVPAFFADFLISRRGNVMLKTSVSGNHRFPTLNDLYFMPGGNPDLRSEGGWTYDAGISAASSFDISLPLAVDGSLTWFDNRIDDWIIWLPTAKGFFTPRNIKSVHAYGVESRVGLTARPARDWSVALNCSYSWTSSVNKGEKISEADQSIGKQLPYIPLHSASLTGRLGWRKWRFAYKWAFYSERYTMSSNEQSITGRLPAYFMSNISLERDLSLRPVDLQLKLAVNNLFNEDYLSVLSRPMPGINFEFFIGITPKLR